MLSVGAPVPIIFGAMRDKDVAGMVRELSPAVSLFATVPVNSPRAMPATELAEIVRRVSTQPCVVHDDVREAVKAVCYR